MLPIVHGLEEQYWNRVDFVYLDHLDPINREMTARYSFTWRPLFILIEPDGTEVQRWFGYVEAEDFQQALDALLAGS
jgi:hypothetical protein